MTEDRFKVIPKSQSAHCCFAATVVDTTKPYMVAGKQWNDECVTVCECFSISDAEMVCTALNGALYE